MQLLRTASSVCLCRYFLQNCAYYGALTESYLQWVFEGRDSKRQKEVVRMHASHVQDVPYGLLAVGNVDYLLIIGKLN